MWPMPRANRKPGERSSAHDRAPIRFRIRPRGGWQKRELRGPGDVGPMRATLPPPPAAALFLRERRSPWRAAFKLLARAWPGRSVTRRWGHGPGPRLTPVGRAPPGAEGASGLARRSLMPRPVGIMHLGQHSKPAIGRPLRLAWQRQVRSTRALTQVHDQGH
jgi:hypothetical protein